MPAIPLKTLAILLALPFAVWAQTFTPIASDHQEPSYLEIKVPGAQGRGSATQKWKILRRPSGGWVGYIQVKDCNEPLTARMRIYEVDESDLFAPTATSQNDVWFQPSELLKPGRPVRKQIYERTWPIDPAAGQIPVIIPRDLGKGLKRCRMELLSADGHVLFDVQPAEVFALTISRSSYYRASSVWIVDDDETAEHRISKQTGLGGSGEKIQHLPDNWHCYTDLTALWAGSGDTELPTETLRRFILTGGWIYGRPESMPSIAQKLDLPPNARILGGGLRGLNGENKIKNSNTGPLSSRNHPGVPPCKHKNCHHDPAPLENRINLFERFKPRMLAFTLILAGVYSLGACIYLPMLYLQKKAAERISLWWKVPAATLGCTGLAVVLGWGIILPKQPISKIIEYRYGYADWPEVFCHTDAHALKYGRKDFGWNLPPDCEELKFKSGSNKRIRTPQSIAYLSDTMGMKTSSSFAHFEPMRQPFKATLKEGKLFITSDRDVRNCFVSYHKLHTQKIGTLNAGETTELTLPFSPVPLAGIPNRIEKAMDQLNASGNLPTVGSFVFVVALDEQAQPAISALNGEKNQIGRVAWVSQVPVEGGAQ